MNQTPLAPMGVGTLLDRSFVVYRQHFGAFFLLALMLSGPFLLLQDLLIFDLGSMSFFAQDAEGSDFLETMAKRFEGNEDTLASTDQIGFVLLYLLVVLPLMTLGAYPQLISATLLLTKAAVEGRELGIKGAMKQAFSRFWPLVGATFVYLLVMLGILIGFMVVCGLFVFLFSLLFDGSVTAIFQGISNGEQIFFVFFFIVVYLLFVLAVMVVLGFFTLRWGFYLPFTLLEGDTVALGKSWRLTQGNFWRLLGLYLVMTMLYSILSSGVQVVLLAGLGTSVLSQLIMLVVSCLLIPLIMIVYSLAYFDLRVRKDGTDLQAMLEMQQAKESIAEPEQGMGASYE